VLTQILTAAVYQQVQDLPLTHDAGASAAEVATIMPHVATALSKLDELTKV
jgi:hypothetical protein